MASRTDHQVRKDTILGIVVDHYIQTVTPVSSGLISQVFVRDLSSATIRNILAELEREGYLTHPHTSAGRVPTQEGYRYFVDHLMKEIRLLEEEQSLVKEEYERQVATLEDLLEKTSQVLSELTQYTSIVSFDGFEGRLFCRGTNHIVNYPELVDFQKIRDILRALEEKERIMKILNRELETRIKIYIGHEMACEQIDEVCSLAVAPYRTSTGRSGRIAVLGPTRMNYARVVSALDYVASLLENYTT